MGAANRRPNGVRKSATDVAVTVLLDECVKDLLPSFEQAGWKVLDPGRASVDDEIACYARVSGCVVVTRDKHLRRAWRDEPFRLVFIPGQTLKRRRKQTKDQYDRLTKLAEEAARAVLRTDGHMARVSRGPAADLTFRLPLLQSPRGSEGNGVAGPWFQDEMGIVPADLQPSKVF